VFAAVNTLAEVSLLDLKNLNKRMVMKNQLSRRVFLFLIGLFILGYFQHSRAQSIRFSDPEEVGLSLERLYRIQLVFQNHIDKGEISGVVTLIARKGKIAYFKTFGEMDIENHIPIPQEGIFRIASMTKIVTSVAALMLLEQSHYMLYDPVSKYLSEFKDMQVAAKFSNSVKRLLSTEPVKRQITIQDLLRHTSGITYASGSYIVDSFYREAGLRNWDRSLKKFVETLTEIPLAFQPGEKWEYSLSTDVLGYIIEVISGKRLNQYFEENIFKPIGMTDTDFYVPAEKLYRLPNIYEYKNNELILLESNSNTPLKNLPPAFSGGGGWAGLGSDGGLVSTAKDYFLLLQMLLNGGELNGTRLLSPKTVELMMSDNLNGIETWLGPGVSFGLGFAVVTDLGKFGELGSEGMVYWAGSDNTHFFIDPKEEMIGIVMMQMRPFGHLNLMDRFRQLAIQAIID
jgi:CubicO group peptidase (beta-lactamase class C family)